MHVIARHTAIAQGLTHFFTGVACVHGHVAPRYASNKRCVICASATYGQGTGRARQDARQAGEKFYVGRPCPQGHVKRYASTGVCFHCAKGRSLSRSRGERRATPTWFSADDRARIERTRAIADLMSEATGQPWELDHIVPIAGKSICGLHIGRNVQAMPRALNRRKSNRFEVTQEDG